MNCLPSLKSKILVLFISSLSFIAGCEIIDSEDDNTNEEVATKEVIIERVVRTIYRIYSFSENQYSGISSFEFTIILNPPKDSVNCTMNFNLTMKSEDNYDLYLRDLSDKKPRSWLGRAELSIKSTHPNGKLFDVVGYKNAFVSGVSFSLPLIYTGDNILSYDAKIRSGEFYKTYKMLHLHQFVECFKVCDGQFAFKQRNTKDGSITALTNTYIHHDFANPDGIENPDSLNLALEMWDTFCNTWDKQLELNAIEIPVQITFIDANVHVSQLTDAGIKTNDLDIWVPLSIHK